MAETIAIVYVGNKPVKKDTVCGTDLLFPRLEPIAVTTDIAPKFLRFKEVWVKEDQAKDFIKQQDNKAAELAEREREAQELAAQEAEAASMLVEGVGDLGKMTSVQLATLAESESLDIKKKGAQEKLPDYAIRVRDALKAKSEE